MPADCYRNGNTGPAPAQPRVLGLLDHDTKHPLKGHSRLAGSTNEADSPRFNLAEVEEAIRTSPWLAAELGKLECRKDFPFHAEWNGHYYATKQVRPIFVETDVAVVVITVYTYYF